MGHPDKTGMLNDNEQFMEWVYENFDLRDVTARCPSVISEILEEFNNDWFDHVDAEYADDNDAPEDELYGEETDDFDHVD